jgi:hypothetical protein
MGLRLAKLERFGFRRVTASANAEAGAMWLLKIVTVLLVAAAMDMALAHALELPGKLRLPKDQYLAAQAIYYPGFRFGGVAEPLGIAAVTLLAFLTPPVGAGFWLTVSACIALLLTHAVYWIGIYPVNSFWLRDIRLEHAIRAFFAVDLGVGNRFESAEWTYFRDRWEYSHLARAVLAVAAFVLLVTAVTR